MFSRAICRTPGLDFAQGITTSSHLGPPSYTNILVQHQAYVQALRSLGLQIDLLDALPGFPDAYFVEDVAVVLPEAAVITRPGAQSRRGEVDMIVPALVAYRELEFIQAPGTVEGGDVLMAGRHFFVGISERTNEAGARQLGTILESYGFSWTAVPVAAGLHLKSSLNWLGGDRLFVTEAFKDRPELDGWEKWLVAAGEEYASNTLWVNDHLITPASFPRTLEQLQKTGIPVVPLEVSEVQKMDGGLTCMSLRF